MAHLPVRRIVMAAALLAAAVLIAIGVEARFHAPTADPYTAIVRLHARNPAAFERAFLVGFNHGVMGGDQDLTLASSRVEAFEDFGQSARLAVHYEGTVAGSRQPYAVTGESWHIFHHAGLIGLQSLCSPELADCSGSARLMQRASASALRHLGETSLEGILPTSDNCTVQVGTLSAVVGSATVESCTYLSTIVLQVFRLDAASASKLVGSIVPSLLP